MRANAGGIHCNRRVFLLAGSGVLIAGAAGCSALQFATPDPMLRAMFALAERDAQMLNKYGWIRAEHARVIGAEIDRACGVRNDGTVPQKCVARPTPAHPPSPADAVSDVSLLTDSLASPGLGEAIGSKRAIRSDYSAAVAASVTGGIMLAARLNDVPWQQLVPSPPPVDDWGGDDDELVAEALRDEYALIYGMGVAAPRVPAPLRESTMTSAERHRSLRDGAIAMLNNAGAEVPAAGGGYVADPGIADIHNDPAGFAEALEEAVASSWRAVIANGSSPQLRLFALRAAGLAHAGAAVFTGEPEVALPGLTS